MKDSYSSFHRYLVSEKRSMVFIRGDIAYQWQVIDLWEVWMHSRAISRTSINTYWRGAAMLFAYLAQRGDITNPFAGLRPPKPAVLAARCIDVQDAPKLLSYVTDGPWPSDLARWRNVVIMLLLVPHGLRRSEVLRLTCGDIDAVRGQILIRNAKGRDGGRNRTAMMSNELHRAVQRYIDERARAGRLSAQFLVSATRDSGIGISTLQRLCKQVGAATGVHFSPHMLRHTTTNILRISGVNDETICAQLGWTDRRMLQRYSHVEDAERAEAMRGVSLDPSDVAHQSAEATRPSDNSRHARFIT